VKIQIRDREVFDRLNPADVAGYLRAQGWQEKTNRPEHSSLWHKDHKGEDAELLLPLNRSYQDFALRMADAVQLLAAMEARSQLEILEDIHTANVDVIRIQLKQIEAADGSILVAHGAALYENISEMFLAAACAALEPRMYFATRKPKPAEDYVRQLRFGQSDRGSYVVRVFSKVPPALTALFEEVEEPFERKTVRVLMHALHTLRNAADQALTSGQSKPFEEAMPHGVSANLCQALARMAGGDLQSADELIIRVFAAKTRSLPADFPRHIAFPGDRIPIIEEASRVLRSVAPREETEIIGYVVKLQRNEGQGPLTGPVTVTTLIDGQMRKVSINLEEPDHHTALSAYERGVPIACRGDLVKQGQQWTLRSPRGFMLTNEE
jgi:hypothetical protein